MAVVFHNSETFACVQLYIGDGKDPWRTGLSVDRVDTNL